MPTRTLTTEAKQFMQSNRAESASEWIASIVVWAAVIAMVLAAVAVLLGPAE